MDIRKKKKMMKEVSLKMSRTCLRIPHIRKKLPKLPLPNSSARTNTIRRQTNKQPASKPDKQTSECIITIIPSHSIFQFHPTIPCPTSK